MRSEQRFSRGLGAVATLVAVVVAFGLAAPASAAPACTTSPSISSVVPAFGTVLGGTSVVINGTGFCSTGLKVWFGANKVSNAHVSFVSSIE
ncbi:MAG TPA: IPT/TIG domain-containing protein, partial [Thermoanaerobaculia bacterium]|nr:IPT/TIG domain-containing protein [Thermoanaerobaculia bacterium]